MTVRVERYFAFVDLCGFTRFTDAQGDEEAVSVLREFRAVVREVASEWGVRIAKWLGDGAMFVSTSAEPLVSAVLELQRRVDRAELTLPLRCGLAGGAVILFEGDDYIGGPVNLAARLCDAAGPYEVLASAEVAGQAPDWATVTPVGARAVHGLSQPVGVMRIAAMAAQAGG